ncbi:hypothetical protein [Enhygromyxa salina]|uniref:Uncharacterized protein n=1 Tax=Enhygromyxa salina TaxID=215803 RepID=A0A2S9XTL4_9BACT|nr:hypothetical protein [Enhygromyxa salina]PRP96061.1 hypothetical protein ENSA7_68750 [Enhygromyxa salina]
MAVSRPRAAALGLGVVLSGCNLLELGPASKITTTEIIATRVRVVELGPLDPERVYIPSVAPVAELLPGDRVRAELVVVDPEGLPLATDELDSIWLARGRDNPGLHDPVFDVRCEELDDWTMDSDCRLGEGRSAIEFTVPPLAEDALAYAGFRLNAVVAWNGERAENCWATRRAREVIPPDCGFIEFNCAVGPIWWLQAYARSQGLPPTVPPDLFPAPIYGQQANRPPVVEHIEVEVDGEIRDPLVVPAGGVAGPVHVEAGDSVKLLFTVDPLEQLAQVFYVPLGQLTGAPLNAFTVGFESVWVRVSTSASIEYEEPENEGGPVKTDSDSPIVLHVDEEARAGTARVVVVVNDRRGAEEVYWVELEVQ